MSINYRSTEPRNLLPVRRPPVPLRPFKLRPSDIRRLLGLIWQASGILVVAWVAILLVQGVIPVAIVWLTKPLVDSLQAAIGAGVNRETIQPLANTALALGARGRRCDRVNKILTARDRERLASIHR